MIIHRELSSSFFFNVTVIQSLIFGIFKYKLNLKKNIHLITIYSKTSLRTPPLKKQKFVSLNDTTVSNTKISKI